MLPSIKFIFFSLAVFDIMSFNVFDDAILLYLYPFWTSAYVDSLIELSTKIKSFSLKASL